MVELAKPRNVHVDESRQDLWGVPIYSVCGYVSTYQGFFDLDEEWSRFLKKSGITTFHATEFMYRKNEFKNNWTNDDRNGFIDRLAWIASEHTTLGFGNRYGKTYLTKFSEIHAMPKNRGAILTGSVYGRAL